MTGGGVVEPLISIRHVQNDMKDEDISQSFCGEEDEIGPINGVKDFVREFSTESKKLWYVAGPSIFTSFCQYALMATTMMVVGHIGTIQLAAVSVENSVIAAIPYGVLVCMFSFSFIIVRVVADSGDGGGELVVVNPKCEVVLVLSFLIRVYFSNGH